MHLEINLVYEKLRASYKGDELRDLVHCADRYLTQLEQAITKAVRARSLDFENRLWKSFFEQAGSTEIRLLLDILDDKFQSCSVEQFKRLVGLTSEQALCAFRQRREGVLEFMDEKTQGLGELTRKLLDSPLIEVFLTLESVNQEVYRLESGEIASVLLNKERLSMIINLLRTTKDLSVISAKTIHYSRVSEGIDIGQIQRETSEKENLLYLLHTKHAVLGCFIRPKFKQEPWLKVLDPKGESFLFNFQNSTYLSLRPGGEAFFYEHDRLIFGNYDLVICDQFKHWAKYDGHGAYVRLGRSSSAFESHGDKQEGRVRLIGPEYEEDRWEKCDRLFFKFDKIEVLKLTFAA